MPNSFPFIAASDARVLILGSMPGAASLAAHQYYAHPRNAFWTILAAVTDVDPGAAYADRCAGMIARRIALWDVLAFCRRPDSLDSSIDPQSVVVNDFGAFFELHPKIDSVLLNGAAAQRWYAPIARQHPHRRSVALPSTSPANASWSLARKRAVWTSALIEALS